MSNCVVRRAVCVATFPCLAVFLAGCGGGGSPTPAPTPTPGPPTPPPAPTPAPTPETPTMPAVKAVCNWGGNGTTHREEVGCDDTTQQLVIGSISLTAPPAVPLGGTETCDMAISGFLKAACTPQGGIVKDQNDTAATCVIGRWDQTGKVYITDVDIVSCDGSKKQKYFSYNTTVISNAPYPTGEACEQSVSQWKDGQESAHKGSCEKDSSVEFV